MEVVFKKTDYHFGIKTRTIFDYMYLSGANNRQLRLWRFLDNDKARQDRQDRQALVSSVSQARRV